jgi:phosphoserine aminotransferase
MTKGGKLIEGIFVGETINTPSMLCVEDYLDALTWAKSSAGSSADRARRRQFKAIQDHASWLRLDRKPRRRSGDALQHLRLPEDSPIRRSPRFPTTSRRPSPRRSSRARQGRRGARHRRLSRCALRARIWCGATVETSDLEALMPWLDWAFETQKAALKAGRLIRLSGRRRPPRLSRIHIH